jgi:hypothetical protein
VVVVDDGDDDGHNKGVVMVMHMKTKRHMHEEDALPNHVNEYKSPPPWHEHCDLDLMAAVAAGFPGRVAVFLVLL